MKIPTPKICSTCAHRNWNNCMKSGYFTKVERQYPTKCGQNFEAWIPRPGIFRRVSGWLFGWAESLTKPRITD